MNVPFIGATQRPISVYSCMPAILNVRGGNASSLGREVPMWNERSRNIIRTAATMASIATIMPHNTRYMAREGGDRVRQRVSPGPVRTPGHRYNMNFVH